MGMSVYPPAVLRRVDEASLERQLTNLAHELRGWVGTTLVPHGEARPSVGDGVQCSLCQYATSRQGQCFAPISNIQ